jgi:hypothetical protein
MGADANTSTPQPDDSAIRLSVLYRASERGNAGLVRLLLEHGANPNDGESTYHAAERNHRDVLELLLAHGAEISAPHPHWTNTVLYFLAGYREAADGGVGSEGMRWLSSTAPTRTSRATRATAASRRGIGPGDASLLLEHGADPSRLRR